MPEPLLERMSELLAISREIASATEYTTLLRRVVAHVASFLEAETAVLLLADEQGCAKVSAAVGLPADAEGFQAPLDEAIGRKLCGMIGCNPARFLAAPVIESGKIRGILAVHRHEPYGREDTALLSGLADQAAIALAHINHVQRLQGALSMLRDADKRKDEFLGVLSHEIRNPLAPIRSSIYILDRADSKSEAAAHARLVLQRQTDHLTRLVDDLLDVTRITRGRIKLTRNPVDLVEVVHRAADDHRSMMSASGIRLILQLDAPLHKVWISGDPTRLAQVVGNLLQNAAKFTPAGGEVSLLVGVADSQAIIRVRDTGAGIDQKLRERVFEPFVQAEQSISRPQGGLGLGLALVKGIVELHGGNVRVESEGAGRGSEFIVSLPLAPAVEPELPANTMQKRSAEAKHILVVDDNHDAADSLAEILKLLGHSVEVAYEAPGALQRVLADPPDAVLCDLGLPGMNGYEFARAVRKKCSTNVRLIAVSGYAQTEDIRQSLEAGFEAHVAKPADPADIDRLLN